jgi:hypothetical protein
MKEPDWSKCTEEELWIYVASHLSSKGIDTLLVGGAVVAIYTKGIYRSGDLDFVLLSYLNDHLPEAMAEIGFKISKSRHYSHPKCKHLIVEFASGPPGIGDDHKIKPIERKIQGQTIKLFSPTDCVRDRLASFIHFGARDCLEQAVLVASQLSIDKNKVKKWCEKEGRAEAFSEFNALLKKNKAKEVK